ncbi:mannose-1-phosphate guanylyltransferase [Patescibacteria group bacterium]
MRKSFPKKHLKNNYKEHLYVLILAGGGGTRLWPKSRNETPKQFLDLFGGETLTQITARRFSNILPWERIFCVTVSQAYKKEILKEVPLFLPSNIIVEPVRRETAPAHGIGAVHIYKRDPEAVIITEAADRLVKPVRRYLKTLQTAAEVAFNKKVLISLGVEPRYPHTGLGHIKRGEKWAREANLNFYKVDKFIEKPSLELAKKYTTSGNYYWNAGQYVWRADSLLEAFSKYSPQIKKSLDIIYKAIGSKNEQKIVAEQYKKMSKIAIDYAVSEKAKNLYVVPGDFFWTDIGDWKEVWENSKKDDLGNVLIDGKEKGGRVINIDTSDALIHTNGRMVAIVDVDNIVIVDTKDALLVCSKSRAQNVKKIVESLKEEKLKEYL